MAQAIAGTLVAMGIIAIAVAEIPPLNSRYPERMFKLFMAGFVLVSGGLLIAFILLLRIA